MMEPEVRGTAGEPTDLAIHEARLFGNHRVSQRMEIRSASSNAGSRNGDGRLYWTGRMPTSIRDQDPWNLTGVVASSSELSGREEDGHDS